MGNVIFTSRYDGQTVKGSVGLSVQFNWSFSGSVGLIRWGIAREDDSTVLDVNQILFTLLKNGPGSFTTPTAYVGRVSGSRSNGLAIFTLRNLKPSDSRFYGCELNPDLGNQIFDNVKLDVEGEKMY